MTVKVTLLDVLLGARRNGGACMVARAVHRQVPIPGLYWLNVGSDRVDLGDQTHFLPATVTAKIDKWDRTHLVWPFSFELALAQKA